MVRGMGLEPMSERWQRPILAARRTQHGIGADEAIRTPVLSLEDSGPTIGRHPLETVTT